MYRLLLVLGVSSVIATACSQTDRLFSGPPTFTLHSHVSVDSIYQCIASRWRTAARHLHSSRIGDTIDLQAQSFYRGVNIGVRLKKRSGTTVVEYFERRLTVPPYAAMVRHCVMPAATRLSHR